MLSSLLNLFYPSLCYGCHEEEVGTEEMLCIKCFQELPYTGFEKIPGNSTEKLFWGRMNLQFGVSIFYFVPGNSIQEIIHQIKYKEEKNLGIFMGRLMGQKLSKIMAHYQIDYCIPMPLHPKKEYKRGYNQASLLCMGIQDVCAVEYHEKVIVRVENTDSQTKKSRIERWNNVETIFSVEEKEKIIGKNILIVDDVITTGASTESCGQILLNHGANSVSIAGMAFTI
jgi:ComF family protein